MGDPGPGKSDQGHVSPTCKRCLPSSGHSSPTPPAHPARGTPEGLSLPSPLYVSFLDPHTGNVHLSGESTLYQNHVTLRHVTYVAPEKELFSSSSPSLACAVRVRYRQREVSAAAVPLPDGRLRVTFLSPVRSPAPGQTAVLYGGPFADEVLAAGEIEPVTETKRSV